MTAPAIKTHTEVGAAAASVTTGNLTVAAGDLIVAAIFQQGGTPACSDTESDAYTQQLLSNAFAGDPCSLYTAIAASSSTTFKVTGGSGGSTADMAVYVIDGTTILGSSTYWDIGAIGNNGGSSVTSATSPTTGNCAGGDETLLAFNFTGGATTASAGTGFTLDHTGAGSGSGQIIADEHKTQTGVTTGVAGTFTLSPGAFAYTLVAVIKGTATAGASVGQVTYAYGSN